MSGISNIVSYDKELDDLEFEAMVQMLNPLQKEHGASVFMGEGGVTYSLGRSNNLSVYACGSRYGMFDPSSKYVSNEIGGEILWGLRISKNIRLFSGIMLDYESEEEREFEENAFSTAHNTNYGFELSDFFKFELGRLTLRGRQVATLNYSATEERLSSIFLGMRLRGVLDLFPFEIGGELYGKYSINIGSEDRTRLEYSANLKFSLAKHLQVGIGMVGREDFTRNRNENSATAMLIMKGVAGFDASVTVFIGNYIPVNSMR